MYLFICTVCTEVFTGYTTFKRSRISSSNFRVSDFSERRGRDWWVVLYYNNAILLLDWYSQHVNRWTRKTGLRTRVL